MPNATSVRALYAARAGLPPSPPRSPDSRGRAETGNELALNFLVCWGGHAVCWGVNPWRTIYGNAIVAKTPSDYAPASLLQRGCDQLPSALIGKGPQSAAGECAARGVRRVEFRCRPWPSWSACTWRPEEGVPGRHREHVRCGLRHHGCREVGRGRAWPQRQGRVQTPSSHSYANPATPPDSGRRGRDLEHRGVAGTCARLWRSDVPRRGAETPCVSASEAGENSPNSLLSRVPPRPGADPPGRVAPLVWPHL
jgi:hypothetical protein